MYKYIFILACLIATSVCRAQTKGNLKLYGYKQYVSGGKRPDQPIKSNLLIDIKSGKNYFLYAVSSSRIYPVDLWIEGKRFGATVKTLTAPVAYGDETNIGSPKKVLVPKTSQRVVQMIPVPPMEAKQIGVKAKLLAASNELVVVYKQGRKFYYAVLVKLGSIDNAAMQ